MLLWDVFLLACAEPKPESDVSAPDRIDWSLSPEALHAREQPYRLEVDPGTKLVQALELGVHGTANAGDWPMAFAALHPELFGPAEALQAHGATPVPHGGRRWQQEFFGMPVTGSFLEAKVNAAGRYELEARLALPPAGSPPDPQTKDRAIAEAQAWLPTSDLATRTGPLDTATAVWFDPGLLAPPAVGLRACWQVYSSRAGGVPGEGLPSADVLVDAQRGEVLAAWDHLAPPSQTWSTLASYLVDGDGFREGFDVVLPALELKAGESVADVGAGSGALSWPLSNAVGAAGRVVATDVDPAAIAFLRHRLVQSPPTHPNIDVRLAFFEDPRLEPASVDAILLWEAHFFMEQTPDATLRSTLTALHAALREDGRLVVHEATANGPEALVRANFEAGGFTWLRSLPGFPGSTVAVFGP